jgi:non-canonical purine NTP pyrophosphatase (RdgB/HAM1 family)
MSEENIIIVASQNKGKISEINDLLKGLDLQAVTMKEAGYDEDIEEHGTTLKENAFIKANAIYLQCNLPVLADDSGLFIDSLGGDPGVYSARYAGENRNSEANIEKVLFLMKNISDRSAHFATTICYIDGEGNAHFMEGKVFGKILFERQGESGFGYDPIFEPLGYDVSFGELSSEVKNKISHRARAMELFKAFITNNPTTIK